MVELIYSPEWFYGKDILIDLISIFVLSSIAYFSLKYYNLDKKNKNYLFFTGSFIILALSFLFKIIINSLLYYKLIQLKDFGFIIFAYNPLDYAEIIFSSAFLMYRLFMLFGLLMLFSIYSKLKKTNILLISYLLIVMTYFSRSAYYVFHLTALMFLIIITSQYWNNYKKTKYDTNRWLFYSFSLITLSQVIFIFIGISTLFYVFAEIVQLIGYGGLLITLIKVLKDGKKKRAK